MWVWTCFTKKAKWNTLTLLPYPFPGQDLSQKVSLPEGMAEIHASLNNLKGTKVAVLIISPFDSTVRPFPNPYGLWGWQWIIVKDQTRIFSNCFVRTDWDILNYMALLWQVCSSARWARHGRQVGGLGKIQALQRAEMDPTQFQGPATAVTF